MNNMQVMGISCYVQVMNTMCTHTLSWYVQVMNCAQVMSILLCNNKIWGILIRIGGVSFRDCKGDW